MSESVTLVTVRRRVLVHLKNADVSKVVGVVVPGSAAYIADGYAPDGSEEEHELRLPQAVLDRLLTFYDQCIARDGRVPAYNCHGFVSFVIGLTTSFKPSEAQLGSATVPVRPDELVPAVAYAITGSGGRPVHSLMGVNDPEQNLSVLGMFGPLAISDNTGLRMAYGGSLRGYVAETDTISSEAS